MSFRKYFEPAHCLPHNCDCEYVRDAWIAQPSAFWSSLSYIFFALFLYSIIKKKTVTFKLWILSFILLGLFSHFAHASFIEIAIAMDYAGIILIMSFFFVVKWMNRWISGFWKMYFLLLCYQGGLVLIFYSLNKWVKVGLCIVIFLIAMVELIHTEGRKLLKAPEVQWCLIILFTSFSFFLTDELKIICEPHSLLQGHSLWHLGTSISIFLYGKWRFRED